MPKNFFSSPPAYPTFYRTYSHRSQEGRESWQDVTERNCRGLKQLGILTEAELENIKNNQLNLTALPSGRWLWIGGKEWLDKPKNFYGAYNCSSLEVIDWGTFGMLMNLAMCGTGTGAVLEPRCFEQLPPIRNKLNINIAQPIGVVEPEVRGEFTDIDIEPETGKVYISVGDSREGWVESYQALLELSSREDLPTELEVNIFLGNVRPEGEKLKGFGGTANPVKLPELYSKTARILNKAVGRKLTSVECCLLIDEPAWCVVAGNIRRCLPEDALVHTIKGLVPIRDIQVGDLVQTPIGFRKVINKFDQGFQDVYELDTNATTPRATLNHKYAVLAGATGDIIWKSVRDLEEGDRLLHNKDVLPGRVTSLPPDFTESLSVCGHTPTSIVIPELTPEVAWLIGYSHGNGFVNHAARSRRVTWTLPSLDTELAQKLQNNINSALTLFGLKVSHKKSKTKNCIVLTCGSSRLSQYFYRYIKQSKTTLSIPDFIMQGTVSVRAAYLAGLFDSDGSIKRKPACLVCSIYKSFIREVSSLLSSLGIAGRLEIQNHPKKMGGIGVAYYLNIPCFKKEFNLLISPYSAKGYLHEGKKMYGFSIPTKMIWDSYDSKEVYAAGFKDSPNKVIQLNYESCVEKLGVSLDIPVTFKEVSSYDHVQTYDIEVEEAHCFYCDGYLTHNSAGMRQFIYFDTQAAASKLNLYTQDSSGKWSIDPERETRTMANHTRIYYHRPTLEECLESLRLQYQCGEGAIMFAPEMIARANADLLDTAESKFYFIDLVCSGEMDGARNFLEVKAALKEIPLREGEISHRMERVGLNPCGEIGMKDNLCNLAEVPLNQLNPFDEAQIISAFTAAAHSVCCLLHHQFDYPRIQYSREVDPIVAVSFTGLFDFFVNLFGVDWLKWWEAGRTEEWDKEYVVFVDPTALGHKITDIPPEDLVRIQVPISIFNRIPNFLRGKKLGKCYKLIEQLFLSYCSDIVHNTVWEYCDRSGLRRPNRCTTIQPSGTKSLLTGASPGWHPPKAARFIRRITFCKNDPVALACIDYGYNVVPGQDDRDENGALLDDPFDPRVNTWLVEIPTSTVWADIPGADKIDISKFSALAQLDMLDQVQNYYVTHNTSATVEIRGEEIPAVAQKFYEMMQTNRIVSTTILARMDDKETFPRLPFGPINQKTYEKLMAGVLERRKSDNFHELLEKHDHGLMPISEIGPAPCDSDKCMMP